MNILTNGSALRRAEYNSAGEALILGSPVASVTFSGLTNDRIALDILWFHTSTGVERLDLELNGSAAPGGSRVARSQFETETGVREDRTEPGFTLADLVATLASGTSFEGVAYIIADSTLEERAYMAGEGYANDAAAVLGDRKRFSQRHGRWDDIAVGDVESVSVVAASSNAVIAVNSHVKLFI